MVVVYSDRYRQQLGARIVKWPLIIALLLPNAAMAQSVPAPFSILGAVPTIPQWMSAWQSKQDVFGLGAANQVLATNGAGTGLVWSAPGAATLTVGSSGVGGTCANGYNLYNNAGTLGCQANGSGGGLTLAGSSGAIQTNNGSGNLGSIVTGSGVAAALANTAGAAGGFATYSALGSGAFASAYSLPTATNSVLGGVKPDGTTISNTAGAISINLGSANTWAATQVFPNGSLTLAEHATQAANTIVANATGSSASPTAISVPSCSTASSALTWTSGTGFGCNSISGGSGTLTAGTTATSGFSAGQLMMSDGSLLQVGTNVKATSLALNGATIGSNALALVATPAANTSGDGETLIDTTSASSGNQQFSPRLRFSGQGWKTTASAASQQVDWITELQPVQGTTNANSLLVMSSQAAGGGYSPAVEFATNNTTGLSAIVIAGTLNATYQGVVLSSDNNGDFNINRLDNGIFQPAPQFTFDASNARFTGALNATIGWTNSGVSNLGTLDTYFTRDAAGEVAIQRLANAQGLRVYNTYTDASNYERGVFDWQANSNVLTIGTQNLGTGSVRNLELVVGGANVLDYGVTTASVWTAAANVASTKAFVAAGTKPTYALAGGTCAGTVTAGGAISGTITLTGACAATNTLTLTSMPTSTNGYSCFAHDRTAPATLVFQTATTANGSTFTFSGSTSGATDVIVWHCMGY